MIYHKKETYDLSLISDDLLILALQKNIQFVINLFIFVFKFNYIILYYFILFCFFFTNKLQITNFIFMYLIIFIDFFRTNMI